MEVMIFLSISSIFILFLLGVAVQAQKISRNFLHKFSKGLFIGAPAFIFGWYAALVFFQYLVWKSSPFTRNFLPPKRSIFYVFEYHFFRFLLYYVVAFGVAVVFLNLSRLANRRRGGQFFHPEEPYFGALSIFLLGNRYWNYAWIYYFIFLLGAYLALHLFYVARRAFRKVRNDPEDSGRIPLYWLWLPTAIFIIIWRGF